MGHGARDSSEEPMEIEAADGSGEAMGTDLGMDDSEATGSAEQGRSQVSSGSF